MTQYAMRRLAIGLVLLFGAGATGMPVLADDWSGRYVGARLGYAFGAADHEFSNGAPGADSAPDGALAAVFGGSAVQSGALVYGGEVDFALSDASGGTFDAAAIGTATSAEADWQVSVRGILGHAGQISERPVLFFVAAGYAFGRFDVSGGPSAFPAVAFSDGANGWTVGLGMDTRLSDRLSLRVEYRYADFGSVTGPSGLMGTDMTVDLNQHDVSVGLRLNF